MFSDEIANFANNPRHNVQDNLTLVQIEMIYDRILDSLAELNSVKVNDLTVFEISQIADMTKSLFNSVERRRKLIYTMREQKRYI